MDDKNEKGVDDCRLRFSGRAGIQADIKTFSAHGVYGMSIIVSVVIKPDMIAKQIDAVFVKGCSV